MIEIDSTFRDRESFFNPCEFHLEVNKAERTTCLESFDPVSESAPQISWTGNTVDEAIANVITATGSVVGISMPWVTVSFAISLFKKENYYKGLVVNGNLTVTEYEFIGVNGGLQIGKFKLFPFPVAMIVGDAFTLNYTYNPLPINVVGNKIRLFVPACYSTNSLIVYNETNHSYNKITYSEDCFVTFITKNNTWQYNHVFSLREKPPSYVDSVISHTHDTVTVNQTGPGNILYIPSIQYFGKILSKTSTTFTISPFFTSSVAVGSVVQTLEFSYDNKQSLRYLGSPNQQERTWHVSIVDVQIPNQPIKNSSSLTNYSTLYLELRDQHYSPHDVLMSNNRHCNTALFRLSADTSNNTKNFFSYTTSKNYKTFRFTPNRSSFLVRILTSDGDVVKFREEDNKWPLQPKRHLQMNISFMTKMM